MPYLSIQTNVKVREAEQEALLKRASEAVAEALGKPEAYVMVNLSAGRAMMFAGSSAPLAYLKLKSLGMPHDATSELSAALCNFMHDVFGVAPERVYIEFSGPERHMWGWNGGTF